MSRTLSLGLFSLLLQHTSPLAIWQQNKKLSLIRTCHSKPLYSHSLDEFEKEYMKVRNLSNRELRDELRQGHPNAQVKSSGVFDRSELERLLVEQRIELRHKLIQQRRQRSKEQQSQAYQIEAEVRFIESNLSYRQILHQLRELGVEFNPLDEISNLITILALARLKLIPTNPQFINKGQNLESSSDLSNIQSKTENSDRNYAAAKSFQTPTENTNNELDIEIRRPSAPLSSKLNLVSNLMDVETDLEQLQLRRRQNRLLKLQQQQQDDAVGPSSELPSSDDDALMKDLYTATTNDWMNPVPFAATVDDNIIDSSGDFNSDRINPPLTGSSAGIPNSGDKRASYESNKSSKPKKADIEVDSVEFATELLMKSALAPILLFVRELLSLIQPSIAWEGPFRALFWARSFVMNLLIQLSSWAAGNRKNGSLAMFAITSICLVGRKGVIWFILSFFVLRTVRVALLSSASLLTSPESQTGENSSPSPADAI